MKKIGLTGGIASGKSTVSNILKELGGIVIDADIVARDIVRKGEPALKEIEKSFGKEIFNKDGTLNRKALGDIVFNDKNKLELLNRITHPKIISEINKILHYYKETEKANVVFIDSPLLIEMNMHYEVDEVWLVVVKKDIQIKRLMARDGISLEDALRRINSQMPLEEKKRYADIIINNCGNIEDLQNQVIFLWNKVFGGA